jgi:V/A-type H+-transporting ATPase subunit I
MKHAFIVLVDRDKRQSLRELRRLGVLHLEPIAGSGQAYNDLVAAKDSMSRALGLISEFKAEATVQDMDVQAGIELAADIRRLEGGMKVALDEAVGTVREIERVRPWGNFDPAMLKELAARGVAFRLVELVAKKLGELPVDLDYVTLGSVKGIVRLALLAGPDVGLPAECLEFTVPAMSLSALESALSEERSRAEAAKAAIAAKAPYAVGLAKALVKVEREIMLEAAHSGMPTGDGVAWFSAWVPVADEPALVKAAAAAGWGLLLDVPQDDEQPPTKVENPALVRMIAPVFDFLGTVPNYREYDISGLFLFFFTFFFAMIFGDAGYGTIFFLLGLALVLKTRLSGKRVPDVMRLMLVLTGATVVWGALTMTWFGVSPDKVPSVLQSLALPWLSNANPESGDNVKVLCFMLGLVQLSIAHLKNIRRDFPSPKFIAQFGQLIMVDGMFFLVLNLVISTTKYPIPMWALYLVLAGFILNFMFANWESGHGIVMGLVKSVIGSLANIVSIFLGIVNIFADIVSYIRLWAVGLAGLAISQTINNMADPMFGHLVLYAAGILLLVFGHGLNVIMSLLSVVVHGVRLNVLEFSGHLGMEWSGYKYEPFKDPVQAERAEMERSLS